MLSDIKVSKTQRASSEKNLPVQTRFNQRAATYQHYAQVQQDMACWLAKWLPLAAQCSPSAALDLGAGSGTFTRCLANGFTKLCALDAAANMVALGQQNLPQADWQQGDAWTLRPLEQRISEFGLVTSSSLLQWCPQPQQTLHHWAQLCKPGTRMLHGFYVEPTLWQWRKIFGTGSLINWRSAEQWVEVFEQSDWQIVRSETCVRDYRFANALELARSLHGTGVTPKQGSLAAGRFRSLLCKYDTSFPTTGETIAAETKTAASKQAEQPGVVATWAFFRIEVIRR